MATWAEFELADPELAAFGKERLDHQVCFHATLRLDGSPRVHPIEAWIAVGLLLVRFRARSPKVAEVLRDGRYALHSPMDNLDGEGGEFLVRGWMEQIGETHPAVQRFEHDAPYAARVLRDVRRGGGGHDVRGGRTAVYRRWRPQATRPGEPSEAEKS